MCCDQYENYPEGDNEQWSECPECGMKCVEVDRGDGEYLYYTERGCNYSPVDCYTCGHRPCDQSC